MKKLKKTLLVYFLPILCISCNGNYVNFMVENNDTIAAIKVQDEDIPNLEKTATIFIKKKYAKDADEIAKICGKLLSPPECRFVDELFKDNTSAVSSVYIVENITTDVFDNANLNDYDYSYTDMYSSVDNGKKIISMHSNEETKYNSFKMFHKFTSFKMDDVNILVVERESHYVYFATDKRLNELQLWALGRESDVDMVYFFDKCISDYKGGDNDYACYTKKGINNIPYLMVFDNDEVYTEKEISKINGFNSYTPRYDY